LEYILLSKLNFQLEIYHPYNPLYGFCFYITRKFNNFDTTELRKAAELIVTKSYSTDLCFLYPPSQIALSAMEIASEKLEITNIFQNLIDDDDIKQSCKGKIEILLENLRKVKEVLLSVDEKIIMSDDGMNPSYVPSIMEELKPIAEIVRNYKNSNKDRNGNRE